MSLPAIGAPAIRYEGTIARVLGRLSHIDPRDSANSQLWNYLVNCREALLSVFD